MPRDWVVLQERHVATPSRRPSSCAWRPIDGRSSWRAPTRAPPARTRAASRRCGIRRAAGCWSLDDPRLARLIGGADAVVDGLLGLGATPPLRPPMDRLVELAATSDGWRIAIDLPSGIDADTGGTDGPAFAADVTVTIGAMKSGLLLAPDLAGRS